MPLGLGRAPLRTLALGRVRALLRGDNLRARASRTPLGGGNQCARLALDERHSLRVSRLGVFERVGGVGGNRTHAAFEGGARAVGESAHALRDRVLERELNGGERRRVDLELPQPGGRIERLAQQRRVARGGVVGDQ